MYILWFFCCINISRLYCDTISAADERSASLSRLQQCQQAGKTAQCQFHNVHRGWNLASGDGFHRAESFRWRLVESQNTRRKMASHLAEAPSGSPTEKSGQPLRTTLTTPGYVTMNYVVRRAESFPSAKGSRLLARWIRRQQSCCCEPATEREQCPEEMDNRWQPANGHVQDKTAVLRFTDIEWSWWPGAETLAVAALNKVTKAGIPESMRMAWKLNRMQRGSPEIWFI